MRVWLGATGVVLIFLGWAILFLAMMDPGPAAGLVQRSLAWVNGYNLGTLGQSLILTGFGCVIVQTLREGFGALQRFFDAILTRTARPSVAPPPAPEPRVDEEDKHDVIVDRGWIKDRPYVVYADGSTEIETRIGMRRFKSHQDARAFVGG
ncbi:MAG TPA: hypothetical protein VGU72_11740 [Beijerinckiaceae bacterium]|jgi:hypothetical protein|nr:hypothetical protein [Beijerinckiaceae bacterium]